MAAERVKTRTPGVFERGSRYVVIYRDHEGKQRQRSARTYAEARALKGRLTAAVHDGDYQAASKIRLGVYAREWVERYQGRGRRGFRESTRDDYRRDLERYAIPYLDHRLKRTVSQVSPRDIANLVGWLCDDLEQGRRLAEAKRTTEAAKRGVPAHLVPMPAAEPLHLADATVRRILAPLRACMASALAEGLIRANPTSGVAMPVRDEQRAIDQGTDLDEDGEDPTTVKALTTNELATFLNLAPPQWRVFFDLIAATGLRWSEAVALRWADIALNGSSPHVHVRRSYVRGVFGPPKTKYSKRKVPLAHDLVVALRDRHKTTEWPGRGDLVFPSQAGTPLQYSNVRRRVLMPLAEEAGVPWVGFHTLRHTCATRLFAAGRNAVQVQRWLGHHSAAFTLSVYVHLLDDDLGDPLPPVSAVGDTSTPTWHTWDAQARAHE